MKLIVTFLILFCGTVTTIAQTTGNIASKPSLPEPFATASVKNFSNVKGWDEGQKPTPPKGFEVTLYASGLSNPRNMYVLPNGDVLVAEANTIKNTFMKVGAVIIGAGKAENLKISANRITLLRDTDKDGIADLQTPFIEELNQPFGMLLLKDWLYVANTNSLVRYHYTEGMTKMDTAAEIIMELPANDRNQHWTRNLIASEDGTKIYIAVGSVDNIGDNGKDIHPQRACIIEINPDGTGMRIYASGLRNPVGMGWAPGTKTLWTTVNERDELGDDLVPDYLTSVKPGVFMDGHGAIGGKNEDPRMETKRPDLVAKAIVPDLSLGAHTASLCMTFYNGSSFPAKYRGGAFIAQHGSWNRKVLAGYRVIFVPFKNGKPSGPATDFLTGFKASETEEKKVFGRPVGIAMLKDGSLLVTDDVNDRIWKVTKSN